MRIRILLLIKVMGICDHWSVDPGPIVFRFAPCEAQAPLGLRSEDVERGFSEKMSTQPMKIFNFLGLPCKKVSESKMDFFKMWIPQ
jgi:hypothetical protein